MTALQIFALGAFGAFLQELLWWFNARHSLDEERYARLTRSLGYWLVTLTFIVATGALVVVWYMGGTPPTARDCLLIGAAAPLLIKQGFKAAAPSQHLGASAFSFRDYLQ